jgi:hypothetical protein
MHTRKRNRIRQWILKRAVLGFALAALVVPAAAQARVDEAVNGQSSSAKALVRDYEGIETNRLKARDISTQGVITDIGVLKPGDHAVSTPHSVSSPGFDWGDAGIGAGIALGLVLLGGAAFRASRLLGKPQSA